jgi:predicted nucleic acid-binding protein
MIVIADTSPLRYLILLKHAEVLHQLYGRVIIPEAVVRELQAQNTPVVVRQWLGAPPNWLQIRRIVVPPDPALAELDPGEREAIALAETLRADALIIDEKLGRREAERRKLRVIGTVRVLDDAAEAGLVNLPSALSQLREFGFYVDTKLLQFLLDRDSERQRRKTKSQGQPFVILAAFS